MIYNQLTQEQFEEKVKIVYPNLEIISKYTRACDPIKYTCKICGIEQVCNNSNSIMQGHRGCSFCSGRKLYVGKNDFATLYPQYLVYFDNKEDAKTCTFGSSKKFNMHCPICGEKRFYQVTHLLRKGFACPKCGDGFSYPNKFMYNLLNQLDINFEREKSFYWSENKIYDFVIDKTIIEMDGKLHLGSKNGFGLTEEEAKIRDNLKDKLAIENGYNIIRIECFESDFNYIKNKILNSKITEILYLSNVNWIELEKELINTNLVKKASDYFNENKGKISIKEIADLLKIRTSKLCSLLKIANRLGWCEYNPKDSLKGKYTPKEIKQKLSKRVICLETNEIFNSAKEAENYFGFNKDSVASVCRGNKLTVHNYHFEFIDDYTEEIKIIKEQKQINKDKKSHNQKKVLCVELNMKFESASEASRYFNHGTGYVSSLIINNRCSDLNYHFKYI